MADPAQRRHAALRAGRPRRDLTLASSDAFAAGAVLSRYRINPGGPDHA